MSEPQAAVPAIDAYARLVALLDAHGATYSLIDHAPESRTDLVSAMRGHAVADAAKCMVVMVKIGKKSTRFVLAVVPGDRKVDIAAIQRLKGGTFARFADPAVAERLAQSVAGTILPFTFDEDLELVADPALAERPTLYFNAARLDRSIALKTADYLAIAKPRMERIVAAA